MIVHSIEAVFDKDSEILILGSFPSVLSRERGFFYANPNNRFWKVLGRIFRETIGESKAEKIDFLRKYHIALYDVIAMCEIQGSSDSSIKNALPADLSKIFNLSKIQRIYTNGKLAHKRYLEYQYPITQIEAINLPSTSSANASYSLDRLVEHWRIISEKQAFPIQ